MAGCKCWFAAGNDKFGAHGCGESGLQGKDEEMNHDFSSTEAIQGYLDDLSDEELKAAFHVAYADCMEAGEKEKDSEWHQSCFAGLLTYSTELHKRGIVLGTKH
jgi:hypothetical protein